MTLREALASGTFVVTVEAAPPKGVAVEAALAEAEALRGRVQAFNVTDQQSSVMRLGSLALCHLLAERGLEPVYQVTCRDRNRIALQSDLLSAAALGIENVLCLTGDHVSLGDHPQAKPVFDLDAVTLLAAARELTRGRDLAGKELTGIPRFFLGAVVSPCADPVEPQILKMEKKVRAGAEFFQTQAVFDLDRFAAFQEATRGLGVPVIAGIVLLKSAKMARFMNQNIPGIVVPEPLISEMESAGDAQSREQASIGIAIRLIRGLRPLAAGVHIMAMGWEHLIPRLLEAADLSAQPVEAA
ncbi:MAG: methylenetetrahydrofolate reductase [Armatimonadota bacterium]|nr:methylenetetrahydrofolate reductase [Armatimonadota bacterium]MDR7519515.1 methylenetetrahydrofolate reductase [Armatimonadota bacterium]MDR7551117.1 methylenetetrahydrofolate reductase [Armatimonadota bacterium]